jgi:3-hydroxyisobutyrate dehydrogenase-like beta-hydroxyacid dehydrogenase
MCGDKGEETAQVLTEMGWNTSYFGVEIGTASMFKMLRSIFSKGLEALLLELLIAGKRAGIEKALWEDITGFMSENPFDQVASNWVKTHAVAHERRYYEMLQVVETMRELGIEPIMSAGTEAFFKRSVSLGFKDIFTEKPDSMESVIDFMNNRML